MTAIELAENGIRISKRVGNNENLKVWQEILDALIYKRDSKTCVGCIHRYEDGHYYCKNCKRSMGDFYEVEDEKFESAD